MPSPRARMAVWEVDPPSSVQKPNTKSLLSSTVSEGVRSLAVIMDGVFSPFAGESCNPNRFLRQREVTSRISAALALRYSSSIASSCRAYPSAVSKRADSILSRSFSTRAFTVLISSGSSSINFWAPKISAASSPNSCSAFA